VSTHVCRCPGEKHPTFGACLRSKNLRIGFCNSAKGLDATEQKKWDKELAAYRDARAQGIQPAGTRLEQVRQAVEISDAAGKAFDASTGLFS
jgi:hypothetical protein